MYKTLNFILARDALRFLIQKYQIKEINIPYYLCDVIRHTLVEQKCKPIFYHIDDNFYPAKDFSEEDFVLYPNYWGICGKNIQKLINIYPKLIVDNAHAYYNKPSGFACFNAGHKFGYKKSFLWFENNNYNNQTDIAIDNLAEERQKIFFELHKKYFKTNLINIDNLVNGNFFPFVYPYLAESTETANTLVKNLKEEGKTVYRYWNPLPKRFFEYKFYSRLVPIPILPH